MLKRETPMNNRRAFTVIELLTCVVIIAVLLGILLPSMTAVRRSAKEAAQKAQFATVGIALDAFKQDYGDYPPSNITPPPPFHYCGAQKLSEALLGWDLMGVHLDTEWTADGWNVAHTHYFYDANVAAEMDRRKGPYLETTSAFMLGDLFNNPAPLGPGTFVLCDVFGVRKIANATGKIVTAGAQSSTIRQIPTARA